MTLHLAISDHPKIRQMAETLFAGSGDRTTLQQWASRLATSERSLARMMQSETGMSFGRWRQQLHLMIALNELAEGKSVQNVAGTLGYDSVSAFITMFRKALGKSLHTVFCLAKLSFTDRLTFEDYEIILINESCSKLNP
ncbi:helix-turn-helix domain-containing protein [Klebsiella variicola subsp. variicola]|nr:helix-turn-helix domain-containing protein [Klebsiella variicola subsp. variicola]